MSDLRLVIFDVDGTLVDSQRMILDAFAFAYARLGVEMPASARALSYVGLSLDTIFPRLSPELGPDDWVALAKGYRAAYKDLRETRGGKESAPFYPGAREVLDRLRAQDHTLLAVATGKSRRGLEKLIEAHGLEGYFTSRQTADDHPSKPHPAMILAAMAECGVAATRTVMVGDTTYDMDMARAAGTGAIGVSWGYHKADALAADRIAANCAELPGLIDEILE